jgi:hypothetical protein
MHANAIDSTGVGDVVRFGAPLLAVLGIAAREPITATSGVGQAVTPRHGRLRPPTSDGPGRSTDPTRSPRGQVSVREPVGSAIRVVHTEERSIRIPAG